MRDLVDEWPTWAVFAVFVVIALIRSHLTYAAGRGMRVGSDRVSRVARHLDRPVVARVESVVRRWGAPVVTLGFLTIGLQTLVNLVAGALRMPLRRFVPAACVGSLLWAALYTSVGALVWRAVTGGHWWLLLVAGGLVVTIVLISRRVRRVLDPGASEGDL